MAIRERKGRAKPFQVYWNNPHTGKRECASFATRQEAEKEDSFVKPRLKFERESFKRDEEEEKETAREMTLEEAYFLYLREKQFSRQELETQLIAMRFTLELFGSRSISTFSRKELDIVIETMGKASLKLTTLHRRLTVIKAFLNWCKNKDYLAGINFPKIAQGQYEKFIPPTPEELRDMLAVAHPHIQRVIILGSQCGVRVGPSELFRLVWNDVDLEARLIRVRGARKNPNAPWREIPLRKTLVPIFREWRTQDRIIGAEHVIHYEGKPIESIKRAWAMTLKRAGIKRRIRPYDLRHAFATELLANGTDIGTVAKLMGHSSPAMIFKHYQYVLDKQKIEAVESLPEIVHVPKNMCPKEKVVRKFL